LISPFRIGVAFFSWLALASGIAFAHPLGNFTINHLSKLAISGDRADVRYILDMAEIPTYQTMRSVTADGKMDAAQLAAWARTESAALLPQLHLAEGGTAVPLTLDATSAHTKRGAGGLPTMYLTLDAHARLPSPAASESRTFSYSDETFAGRLGWRDVVVAPATEPTHELNQYPNALIGSPRELTSVEIALGASGAPRVTAMPDVTAATSGVALPGASQARSNQLSDMLARGTSDWGFVALTFLVAIALGALHALEPGHGKTLLAISLVGARATVRQATILALALTFAHTIGVLALGVAINLFKGYFVPETIYPWITLLSGVVIAIIGARAVQKQIESRRPLAHVHVHGHAATHDHVHEHVHEPHGGDHHTHAAAATAHAHGGHAHDGHAHDDIEHARAHAIPGTAPLRFGGTVWAAMSGGVAPCPAALVVLLAALALNEVAYGIFVIVAFSFGLAATLTGLGIAVVRGASWLQGRKQFERFVTYGPLVSATVISLIGAVMVGQGFAERGISVSPVVVTAITVLAIIGYAFSHPFAHRRSVEIA
jgi:ABC-type nickel/cobalt efflux system permease component RcnA